MLDLECAPGISDTVTVVKRRGTRAPNVLATAEWFRAEHDPNAFVISNSSADVDRAMNHMVARGRNDLAEMDTVHCCATIKTPRPATICHTSDGGAAFGGQVGVKPEAARGGGPKGQALHQLDSRTS
jgi:hypothetical protein